MTSPRPPHTYKDCGIHKLCPAAEDERITRHLVLTATRKLLKRGQYLYRAGEPLRATYGIRNGSIKSCVVAGDGRIQVIGFHIAGDPIGFNSISAGHYICDAIALESTQICELPFDWLRQLAKEIPEIETQLLGIVCNEVLRSQESLLLLGRKTAEQRLAGFLLSLSGRFGERRSPANQFNLSMSRADIGSYLAIAEETVCRVLAQFEQRGLISVRRRQITLHRGDRLGPIAGEFLADY